MKQETKTRILRILPWVLVVALLGILIYDHYYDSVTSLPMNTPEVSAFRETALEECDSLSKVTVEYWYLQNLQFTFEGEGWTEEEAEALLEDALALLEDAGFQKSYAERYDRRYGTTDGVPQSAMAYFFEKGEPVSVMNYSTSAPFDEWSRVK